MANQYKINPLLKERDYPTDQKPGETLQQYYRRLAQTADKRLERLEKYSNDKYFKPAKDWAYASAMKDIRSWNGESAKRFFRTPPKDEEKLIMKLNDIKKFLDSPTSTKVGITNIYIKKANTINENYGTNFTWDELASYYERKTNEKWDSKFGSKTALKAIGRIQKKAEELGIEIKDLKEKDFKSSNQDVIDIKIQEALKANMVKELV